MFLENLKDNFTKLELPKKGCELSSNIVSKVVAVSPGQQQQQDIQWRKIFIRSGITTALLVFGVDGLQVFAADTSSLGKKAEELYFGKFIDVAKWIIIIKGGWDVVSKALKEDFAGAKKSIMSYLLVFAVLMGLPWALGLVEDFFRGETA